MLKLLVSTAVMTTDDDNDDSDLTSYVACTNHEYLKLSKKLKLRIILESLCY
jgi:hypothetical protein